MTLAKYAIWCQDDNYYDHHKYNQCYYTTVSQNASHQSPGDFKTLSEDRWKKGS